MGNNKKVYYENLLPPHMVEKLIDIIKIVKPYEIWLFGSFAKSKQTISSDIDLFIVKKKLKKNTHDKLVQIRNKLNKFTKKYNIEVDLFIDSVGSVEKKLKEQNPFYKSVFYNGKKIYCKKDKELLSISSKQNITLILSNIKKRFHTITPNYILKIISKFRINNPT